MSDAMQPSIVTRSQLLTIFFVQMNEGYQINVLYPFVVFMIRSFGVDEQSVGLYAGILTASFCFSQFCSSFAWGYIADLRGRRFALLIGLFFSMVAAIIFGTSKHFYQAVIARIIGGFFNGNITILKCYIADITDSTNRSFVFSILVIGWGAGVVLGSICGGLLVKLPFWIFKDGKFAYLMPCIIAALTSLNGLIWSAIVVHDLPPNQMGQTVFASQTIEAFNVPRRLVFKNAGGRRSSAIRRDPKSQKNGMTAALRSNATRYHSLGDNITPSISIAADGAAPAEISKQERSVALISSQIDDEKSYRIRIDSFDDSAVPTTDDDSKMNTSNRNKLQPMDVSSLLSVDNQSEQLSISSVDSVRSTLTSVVQYSFVSFGDYNSAPLFEDAIEIMALRGYNFDQYLEEYKSHYDLNKDKQSNAAEANLLKNRDFLLSLLYYGCCSMGFMIYNELLPVYCAEKAKYGGLEFTSLDLGIVLTFQGVSLFLWTAFPQKWLLSKFSLLKLIRKTCFIGILPMFLLPATTYALGYVHKYALILFVAGLTIMRITVGSLIFTGAMCSVNNSVPPNQIGKANGLGQTVAAASRGLGPFIGGALWTWSTHIENKAHVFLAFGVGTLALLGMFATVFSLSDELEKPWFEQNRHRRSKSIAYNQETTPTDS